MRPGNEDKLPPLRAPAKPAVPITADGEVNQGHRTWRSRASIHALLPLFNIIAPTLIELVAVGIIFYITWLGTVAATAMTTVVSYIAGYPLIKLNGYKLRRDE
jgi:hypothetical protein